MQFAGNRKQAMELTEEARRLDLADRYLNAHASKYIFKVDDTKRAEDTMRMFSREDDNGVINVHEM
jgi:peptide alpha-N-acetyltransferase|tara:strand:- start:757 stop:954 length:198 start_codon:yes stop_codon:yes gene_type:complete